MVPYLIGVAGVSCAGKTTLARALAAQLAPKVAVVSLDAYYRDLSHLPYEEREHQNFDHPEAIEWSLLLEHLQQLLAGKPIQQPVYDFHHHVRRKTTRILHPTEYLIIEGLFVLWCRPLRELLNLKIFVDVGEELALARRLERDIRERGRTKQYVEQQFYQHVLPMARAFVLPTKCYADVVIRGDSPLESSLQLVLNALRNSRR